MIDLGGLVGGRGFYGVFSRLSGLGTRYTDQCPAHQWTLGGVSFPLPASGQGTPSKGKLTPFHNRYRKLRSFRVADFHPEGTRKGAPQSPVTVFMPLLEQQRALTGSPNH